MNQESEAFYFSLLPSPIKQAIFDFILPFDGNYLDIMFASKEFCSLTNNAIWTKFTELDEEEQLVLLTNLYSIFEILPRGQKEFHVQKLKIYLQEENINIRNRSVALLILITSHLLSEAEYQKYKDDFEFLLNYCLRGNYLYTLLPHMIEMHNEGSKPLFPKVKEFINFGAWVNFERYHLIIYFHAVKQFFYCFPEKTFEIFDIFVRNVIHRITEVRSKDIFYVRNSIFLIFSRVSKTGIFLNNKIFYMDNGNDIDVDALMRDRVACVTLQIFLLSLWPIIPLPKEEKLKTLSFIFLNTLVRDDPLIYDNFKLAWMKIPGLIEVILEDVGVLFIKDSNFFLTSLYNISDLLSSEQCSQFYSSLATLFDKKNTSFLLNHRGSFSIWMSLWDKLTSRQIDRLLVEEFPRFLETHQDEDKLKLFSFLKDLNDRALVSKDQIAKIFNILRGYRTFSDRSKPFSIIVDLYAKDRTGSWDHFMIEIIRSWQHSSYIENFPIALLEKLITCLQDKFYDNQEKKKSLLGVVSNILHQEKTKMFDTLLSALENYDIEKYCKILPPIWSLLSDFQQNEILVKLLGIVSSSIPWEQRMPGWLVLRRISPLLLKEQSEGIKPTLLKCLKGDDGAFILSIFKNVYSTLKEDDKKEVIESVFNYFSSETCRSNDVIGFFAKIKTKLTFEQSKMLFPFIKGYIFYEVNLNHYSIVNFSVFKKLNSMPDEMEIEDDKQYDHGLKRKR